MIKKYFEKTIKQKLGVIKIDDELNSLKTELRQNITELNNLKTEFFVLKTELNSFKSTTESRLADFYYEKTIQRIKDKIKNGKKINVIFIVIHRSVWQYDNLYKRYSNDKSYNPSIIVAPYTMYGKEIMMEEMNETYSYFKNKQYNVIKTYDEKEDHYLDIKSELEPDIVFFTNPYQITKDDYYIFNFFTNSLTCYVPYGIMLANLQQSQFNQPFHNLTWKNFYETNLHYELAEKYSNNKGKNVVITGYPKCDVFLNNKYKTKNVWKKNDKNLKKIIWAPHHSIENGEKESGYSNFLNYHQFMLDISKKYKDKIQIAFKPHPILLDKLKLHPDWGEEKINMYYKLWEDRENTQLELDEYTDLFLLSDGIIMDSISFIVEYMYVNKPALFMVKDDTINNKFNEFGLLAFDHLYKSYNNQDLVNFIENVILKENDNKKEDREAFLKKFLIPSNNQTATDNIFNYIKDQIK